MHDISPARAFHACISIIASLIRRQRSTWKRENDISSLINFIAPPRSFKPCSKIRYLLHLLSQLTWKFRNAPNSHSTRPPSQREKRIKIIMLQEKSASSTAAQCVEYFIDFRFQSAAAPGRKRKHWAYLNIYRHSLDSSQWLSLHSTHSTHETMIKC